MVVEANTVMPFELQLFLMLAILVTAAKLGGDLAQRLLKQPIVFGSIIAGLLLGPTLLNIFGWRIFAGGVESNQPLQNTVTIFADIGVLFLMFIAGLETNLDQLRHVGKTAAWAAVLGVVAPLGFGLLTAMLFGSSFAEALFIGTVLTATSVSISAQTLLEIGQLNSREGAAILGAAVIDDIIGIIVLSLVIAFSAAKTAMHAGLAASGGDALARLFGKPELATVLHVLLTLLLMGAFFTLAILLGAKIVPRVLEFADRLHASYAVPAAALVLLFLFAIGAEYVGQVAAITGAYLAGLFLARTRFCDAIRHAFHPLTYALFVPIFLVSIGLSADTRSLKGHEWLFALALTAVAVLTKIIGCGLGARLTGFSMRESVRVGVGMISRGEVGMIVAQVGLAATLIGQEDFAALILVVLATTAITPVLLRHAFPRAQEVEVDVYESVTQVELNAEEQEYN